MKLDLNSQTLNVSFACRIEDAWVPVPETACTQSGFDWTLNGAHYSAQFTPAGDTLCYTDRKSTRLNSSHTQKSRMPSSA